MDQPDDQMILVTQRDRCTGHARCQALAPELFTLDERGYIDLPAEISVPSDVQLAARTGADSCPEHVFTLRRALGSRAGGK